MAQATTGPRTSGTTRRQEFVGLAVTVLLLVVGLAWAKWLPYQGKAQALSHTHHWNGSATFGTAGSSPSLHGMLAFAHSYVNAVWKAALVAVLVASAIESLVPRRWMLRVLDRRTWWAQGLGAGLVAMPSMMCSCCTAPVAIGLRRRGAPAGAVMAYWLANPLLNPAVLVFLALTMPWPWAATRAVVGLVAVVGAAWVTSRTTQGLVEAPEVTEDVADDGPLHRRYLRALRRYLLVVVPEYLVMVLVMGLLTAPLAAVLRLDASSHPLVVVLVVLVGLALVIPTGGEIPVVAALAAAGASPLLGGALLLALPAVSIPSLAMLARRFPARTLAAVVAWVGLCSLLAAAVLALA